MFSMPLPVAFSLDFTSLSFISFIAGSTKAVSHDEEDLHHGLGPGNCVEGSESPSSARSRNGGVVFACDPSIRTTPTTSKMTRCRCHASWILMDVW